MLIFRVEIYIYINEKIYRFIILFEYMNKNIKKLGL